MLSLGTGRVTGAETAATGATFALSLTAESPDGGLIRPMLGGNIMRTVQYQRVGAHPHRPQCLMQGI